MSESIHQGAKIARQIERYQNYATTHHDAPRLSLLKCRSAKWTPGVLLAQLTTFMLSHFTIANIFDVLRRKSQSIDNFDRMSLLFLIPVQ